jgi:hypothetical protein
MSHQSSRRQVGPAQRTRHGSTPPIPFLFLQYASRQTLRPAVAAAAASHPPCSHWQTLLGSRVLLLPPNGADFLLPQHCLSIPCCIPPNRARVGVTRPSSSPPRMRPQRAGTGPRARSSQPRSGLWWRRVSATASAWPQRALLRWQRWPHRLGRRSIWILLRHGGSASVVQVRDGARILASPRLVCARTAAWCGGGWSRIDFGLESAPRSSRSAYLFVPCWFLIDFANYCSWPFCFRRSWTSRNLFVDFLSVFCKAATQWDFFGLRQKGWIYYYFQKRILVILFSCFFLFKWALLVVMSLQWHFTTDNMNLNHQ